MIVDRSDVQENADEKKSYLYIQKQSIYSFRLESEEEKRVRERERMNVIFFF